MARRLPNKDYKLGFFAGMQCAALMCERMAASDTSPSMQYGASVLAKAIQSKAQEALATPPAAEQDGRR